MHYEVEATVLGDNGQKMQVERKAHTKRIKLKINANTDVLRLSEELVDKCKLIHHSKLNFVEDLISQLKERLLRNKTARSYSVSGGLSSALISKKIIDRHFFFFFFYRLFTGSSCR